MKYRSTIGKSEAASLRQAVERCVAPDGGLYLPESVPVLPRAFINNIAGMSLRDIAYVVASSFFGDDLPASDIKKIVDEAFADDAPLVKIGPDIYALELFHGPTLTVKDYGARFMARLFSRIFPADGPRNVLVATTGNTGAAVANSFYRAKGTNVFVLYPQGRLSRMAVQQFSSLGENIYPVEVCGSIEDCKRLMQAAVADDQLASYRLTGANSINVARLLPLTALSLHAYARLVEADVPDADKALYSIPCGNLSNLVGAALAMRMGLPAAGLVAATNVNSALGRLLEGRFNGPVGVPVRTTAPSMDMSYPSGWSRLEALYGGDTARMSTDIPVSTAVTDPQIALAIKSLRADGYTIDPHGATAYAAVRAVPHNGPKVVFATGHPAKQLDAMTAITGAAIELPIQLTRFMHVKRHPAKVPPTLPALRKLIMNVNT